MDRMMAFFGVTRDEGEFVDEVFPLGLAPFIRLSQEGQEPGRPALVAERGLFGLVPQWAEMKHGRHTYNARSETVASKPSFRKAWAAGQRCIIPCEAIFEPSFETGKAVRWRIFQPGSIPMGIAGVYSRWSNPEGAEDLFTFAMITVNADGHPVMSRFHRPEDEKRMVVILKPEDYMPWLLSSVQEAPRFFQRWACPLDTLADPLARMARPAKTPPAQDELF